jgi:hypothetical protein
MTKLVLATDLADELLLVGAEAHGNGEIPPTLPLVAKSPLIS